MACTIDKYGLSPIVSMLKQSELTRVTEEFMIDVMHKWGYPGEASEESLSMMVARTHKEELQDELAKQRRVITTGELL